MTFRWPWQRPIRTATRFYVATRQESMAAQRRRTDVMLQLAVYKATTTPEQRKAETEDYFTRMREVRG